MADTDTVFPPQSEYTPVPPRLLPGTRWSSNIYADESDSFIIPDVSELADIWEGTVTSALGDAVAVTIDSVTVSLVGTGDDNADAASLAALIEAHPALSQIVDAVAAANVVTITGKVAGQDHAIVDASGGGSSVALVETQDASAYSRVTYGMGIARAEGIRGTIGGVKPSSASDIFAGVVVLQSHIDDLDGMQQLITGHDAEFLIPGSCRYERMLSGGIMVRIVDAVAQDGDVYWIHSGDNAGDFRADSGAVSQVTELTFSGGGGGGTATGDFDGLPPISVADDTDDATNAANWAAAFNANAQYAALGSASAALAVVTVTFSDDAAHAFTDQSAGGPAIADADTQAAVAAVAKKIPGAKFKLAAPGDRAPIEFDIFRAELT